MDEGYRVGSEVAGSIGEGRVVALESSLICQGMPWPDNLRTALDAEEAVRREGAVPATIAVIEGIVRIGLGRDELEGLARRRDTVKLGMRDLPWAELKGLTGGTTVSGTVAVAASVGIRVFATGGIGGVHAGDSMDISSDLVALSRFNMIVVCSGAKSFLDIEKTAQLLETLGVPVVGYRTDELPGFFVRGTGIKVPYRVDEVGEVVRLGRIKWSRGWAGSILVANPVPPDAAADGAVIERAVDSARKAAAERGVKGQALTPFILEQVRVSTQGRSLRANTALVVNNARLAGQIAGRM